jgi:hypothetical protein
MYQQLPECVRRESKAYWFITTAQAGGGIAAFLLLAFAGLVWLAPVGAVLGVIILTKRQGVYNYEKLLALVKWLMLKARERDVLDQAALFRTAAPAGRPPITVRRQDGTTIAVQTDRGRR